MKYIKIVFFICAIFTLFSLEMSAQDNKLTVSAVVYDSKGNLVPGATITNGDTTTIANDSGEFSITVDARSFLSISASGYKTVSAEAQSDLKKVVLEFNSDMVKVAFNTVSKSDVLGGVSSLNIADALATNYTTYSLDNLASLIPGYSGNNIWGMDEKLVLVDGIPRSEFSVQPSEIEDITVLKSAAAVALYGSRAAKGVVSITTKRGVSKGNKFDVRINTGIREPKRYAKYLNSAEYMGLYNEALMNDGQPRNPNYTDEVIANTASGVNPYRYPNVDFYSSDNLKKQSTRSEIIAEYTGGNEKSQFYVNVGNYRTTTLLDIGNGKSEGENRFNVRGNLDIKLSSMISSKINTSVSFYDNDQAQGNFWNRAATLRPNLFSPLIPLSYLEKADANTQNFIATSPFIVDGKYVLGGIGTELTNPFADIYTRGTIKGTSRTYQFDTSLNFNLANVLKGLTFDTQFGIDYNTTYSQNIGNNVYSVYEPTWATDADGDYITTLTKLGAPDQKTDFRTLDNAFQRTTMFFSGALKYKFDYNKVHNFSSLLVAHGYTIADSEVYQAIANANLGFQFNYNYKNKYYLDFTQNMVHSARLAQGNQDAFSPTFSMGWRISKEKFLANSKVINELKLTASAAILNTDLDYEGFNNGSGYNLFRSIYTNNSGAFFSWQEGRQLRTTDVTSGENLGLGFQQRKEYTLGLEASLFKNMIQIEGSYFYNQLTGLPTRDANLYPNYLSVTNPSNSSFIPVVNFLADERKGFDLGINFNKKINKVQLNVGMVATYYETKAYIRNDVLNRDEHQKRQGQPADALFGLKSNGFYTAAEVADIKNNVAGALARPSFGPFNAGDIKYIDVNNDKVIDNLDQVNLGRGGFSGSPLTIGLNTTVKWNNFSLFVLANSSSGAYAYKNNSYYWATAGVNAKYSEPMLGRWTPETAETATYPRLTTTSGANNFRNSDFWIFKTDRISLSRVQLSYDIPKSLVAKTFMDNLGLYINGNELLLIAKERDHMETNFGSSPQLRYYSIGLTAAF